MTMEKAIPAMNKSSLKLTPVNSIRICKKTPTKPRSAKKTNKVGNKSKKEER